MTSSTRAASFFSVPKKRVFNFRKVEMNYKKDLLLFQPNLDIIPRMEADFVGFLAEATEAGDGLARIQVVSAADVEAVL